MRRTRPNKRDYQIVIAVDDSRSMSESCCGDVAIEALVTVCRAMSQLEMGSLAVASFGKKGNIRLLHDFDHAFTAEAGVQVLNYLLLNVRLFMLSLHLRRNAVSKIYQTLKPFLYLMNVYTDDLQFNIQTREQHHRRTCCRPIEISQRHTG